jgi:hypothetical protein
VRGDLFLSVGVHLIIKPLCPDLNQGVPEVGSKKSNAFPDLKICKKE